MKKIIIAFLILLLIAGCNPTPETESEEQGSECDSYSEGGRKIMCYAMEAEDITMCGDIEDRFRDSCVIALAELVYDTSLIEHCMIAKAEVNQKMCKALISEDIDRCFDWEHGSGLSTSLSVRDCIDLTSRKLKDAGLCDLHITKKDSIFAICGDTSDCESQWIDGAPYNAEDCKTAVEEALQYG